MSEIIVGLDLGATKVCSVIAKVDPEDGIEILGVGKAPAMGFRRGEIIDTDRLVTSLKDAINQAEGSSGLEVLQGFTGVGGQELVIDTRMFEIDLQDPELGISHQDVRHLHDEVNAYTPRRSRRFLMYEKGEYLLDGKRIDSPSIGMKGKKLGLQCAMFLAGVGHTEDIFRIVNGSQTEVMGLIPNPFASAEATLEESEKKLGCMVMDIGGGTTEVVVFRDGMPVYMTMVGVGGDHFDSDLGHGLGISMREAERVKINFGSVKPEDTISDELIEIAQSDGGSEFIPVKIIAEILGARMEEVFEMVGSKIHEAGVFGGLKGGIILTGGSALLKGTPEKAADVFGLPTRVGYPGRLAGLSNDVRNPMYSTSVGLVKLGFSKFIQRSHDVSGGLLADVRRRLSQSSIWKIVTR